MATRLGLDGKLYVKDNSAGAALTNPPSGYTELSNAKDVTLSLDHAEADLTTRANGGWRASEPTLKEGTIEFEMQWDTADAGFTIIKNAWFNKTLVGVGVFDGATSGSQGLLANCKVINFGRNEPLEEGMSVPVTLKPAYSPTYAPQFVTL